MTSATYDFKPSSVILSFAISFLGAYIAISLCEQLRQSMLDDKAIHGLRTSISHRKAHLLLLFLMSLSISGVGIWSMHFIGMHALLLYDRNGDMIHMDYNIALSVVSFVCVLCTTMIGMTTASYDVMFSKTKKEILEQLISDTKCLTMQEIRKIDYKKMLIIISTKRLGRLVLGGIITGGGVSIMHYIGMIAMYFNGHIVWDPAIVFASVLVAIVASTAAFWIFFRLLSIFPELEYLRILSALVMAIAVCGMHYIGMLAASYEFTSDSPQSNLRKNLLKHNMNHNDSYTSAVLGANIMLWLITLYMIWHFRCLSQNQGKLLLQADQLAHYMVIDHHVQGSSNNTNSNNSQINYHTNPNNNNNNSTNGSDNHHSNNTSAGQHHHTSAVSSGHSAASAQIRVIAEQYLTKRYRQNSHQKTHQNHNSYVNGKHTRKPNGTNTNDSSTANLTFTQYACLVAYWIVTCRVTELSSLFSMSTGLTYCCCSNDDGGQSSTYDDSNNNNNADNDSHSHHSSSLRSYNSNNYRKNNGKNDNSSIRRKFPSSAAAVAPMSIHNDLEHSSDNSNTHTAAHSKGDARTDTLSSCSPQQGLSPLLPSIHQLKPVIETPEEYLLRYSFHTDAHVNNNSNNHNNNVSTALKFPSNTTLPVSGSSQQVYEKNQQHAGSGLAGHSDHNTSNNPKNNAVVVNDTPNVNNNVPVMVAPNASFSSASQKRGNNNNILNASMIAEQDDLLYDNNNNHDHHHHYGYDNTNNNSPFARYEVEEPYCHSQVSSQACSEIV